MSTPSNGTKATLPWSCCPLKLYSLIDIASEPLMPVKQHPHRLKLRSPMEKEELRDYLQPSELLDSDHSIVVDEAKRLTAGFFFYE